LKIGDRNPRRIGPLFDRRRFPRFGRSGSNCLLPTQSSNQSPNLQPGTEFFAAETGRRNGLIRLDCTSKHSSRPSWSELLLRAACLEASTLNGCGMLRRNGVGSSRRLGLIRSNSACPTTARVHAAEVRLQSGKSRRLAPPRPSARNGIFGCRDRAAKIAARDTGCPQRLKGAKPVAEIPAQRGLSEPGWKLPGSEGLGGGHDRDRTCDPYHVKVVLSR
jgi:hypothetical protein